MTFAEMFGEVNTYFGSNALLTAGTSAKSKEFVNRMYLQLARSFRFYELDLTDTASVTVANTATVAITAGTREIISVRDTTNKFQLKKRDIDWYEQQDQSTDAAGTSEFWLRYGSNILLWPTPSAVVSLQIRYMILPTALSADGDTPVYPKDWHEVIVLLAASRAGYWLGADTKAMNFKSEALGLIAALTEDITGDRMRSMGQVGIARTRPSPRPDTTWPQNP